MGNSRNSERNELRQFFGKKLTEEMLLGRGYFFAKNGKIVNADFPKLKDFDLSDGDDSDEITCEGVREFLAKSTRNYPHGCWIKCLPAEPGYADCQELYEMICIEPKLNVEAGVEIEQIILCARVVEQCCGGWFAVPGKASMNSEYYEINWIPQNVIDELTHLVNGRYIDENFTLIGKPMPEFKDKFHHNPKYTMALNSGWRNVYWHLTINVDEGENEVETITSLYLSTYERETSMFSRPYGMSDDPADARDAVLYICDQYSDEEWEKVKG